MKGANDNMIKKTLTYTDYDGVERTEDYYFNLTEAELVEMELSIDGGMQKKIEKIMNSKDMKQIIEVFKDLILRSYGEKSDDGKRFIKNKEITEAFTQTEAYSMLFMKLATDEKEASDFVNGILPAKFREAVEHAEIQPVKQDA